MNTDTTKQQDDPAAAAAAAASTQDQVSEDDLANFDDAPLADGEGAPAAPAAAAADPADPADPAAAADPAAVADPAAGANPDPNAVLDPELLRAVAEGIGGDGALIPKARFDEATGKFKDELRDVRATVDRMAAERQAALAPLGEPRDFAKERAELKARYNADDSDMDQDAYLDARDALTIEEAAYKGRESAILAQLEIQKNAATASWNAKCAAWSAKHSDALSVGAIKDSVNKFLTENDDQNLTDEQLLQKAEEHMNAEVANLRRLLGGGAPDPKDSKDPKATDEPAANPHKDRNAADAQAQARASAAPDPAAAGAGDRGRGAFPGVLDLKDKDFAALPKDVREAKGLADF